MDNSKSKSPNSRIKGRDINGTVLVTFEQSCIGTRKPFLFEKNVVCESCKGDGIESGSLPLKCEPCDGTGEVGKSLNMFTGKCKACDGIGKVTQACSNCSGIGYGSKQIVE
jgi:molecular chaperone DnaJ